MLNPIRFNVLSSNISKVIKNTKNIWSIDESKMMVNNLSNKLTQIDTKTVGLTIENASQNAENILTEIDKSKIGGVANVIPQYKSLKENVTVFKNIGNKIKEL